MTPLLRKILGLNWVVVITMLGLLAFGVFAIYSASWTRYDSFGENDNVTKQLKMIGLGLVVFCITSVIDYRWIRWLAVPCYLAGIVFLIMLRFKGETLSGASSWLTLGPIRFQPSQVAIVGGIMILALALGELHRLHPVFRNHLLRLVISLLLVAGPFILIALEPDVGSACVWGPVAACMLLVANIPFRYLIVLTLIALIGMPLIYWFGLKDYQKARISVFLNAIQGEEVDTQGEGYATTQVIVAIGSAGWEGKGHKGNRIKLADPDAKTMSELGLVADAVDISDYIFGVVGEEHGYRGSMIMITAFLLLILQCLYIAFYSRDQMGRLIVVGGVTLLFVHVFMNVGMTIQLVPITGLPLPFISSGGTFAVICMFLLGLVESVWIHRDEEVGSEKSIFY
ncbi:MAG: rod shape determining protein RodA [Verrucomicrobiales bacterium]|jgi:rod shape determining protein RodA